MFNSSDSPFALINSLNEEAATIERTTIAPLIEYQAEAFQIIRRKKSIASGKFMREVIDTIKVEGGDFARAQRIALKKAENLGNNCFVIGKYERVISADPNIEIE